MKLKPDESVDQNAPIQGAERSCVDSGEPLVVRCCSIDQSFTHRVDLVCRGNDGRVQENCQQLDKHVNIEEQYDLLSSDSRVF